MKNYRAILKKTGTVLIVVGSIDIFLWVYCATQNLNYPSIFHIPSIIAGIFLLRANLKTAEIITTISALMLGYMGSSLLIAPFTKPVGLWIAEFKLRLLATILPIAIAIIRIGILFWVYRQLRSHSVVSTLRQASFSTSESKAALYGGIIIIILLTVVWYFTITSPTANQAIELAKNKYGREYQYHPTGIRWLGKRRLATLVAYNDREIKPVKIEWEG